jgi:hypothetical protein
MVLNRAMCCITISPVLQICYFLTDNRPRQVVSVVTPAWVRRQPLSLPEISKRTFKPLIIQHVVLKRVPPLAARQSKTVWCYLKNKYVFHASDRRGANQEASNRDRKTAYNLLSGTLQSLSASGGENTRLLCLRIV